MLFGVILLSISLSIDAFGIGTAYGLRTITIPPLTKVIISIQSIIITGISLLFGKWLSHILPPFLAKNIGVLILILMGAWIIWQGMREHEKNCVKEDESTVAKFLIKSLGITIQIIRTPQYCDLNGSKRIDPFESIYLGFALSIDSFGAGVGGGAAGLFLPILPFLTAFCQAVFLSLGCLMGKKLKVVSQIRENVWVMLSGVLLIIIGFLRLL